MSARKSKVVKVNISAGTYKDEAEAVKEANAIKRWLIRYCDKNGYSIKGKVWISTNSAYAGRIINKGRKKEYKPNGKPLPTVVEAHIHMVLFCNPASTIVDALKSYLNKKHMKAVVWDRHCNSRAEVENAVEYAMRQSRKVRTIDYDRKDVLSVDEWGYYEAVERAEAKIKDNMAFTESEPEQTPETLENKSVSSISDTPETLTYKSIKYNYLYYYIVPTSYNHFIIKALLQDIIYYDRESSRSFCSKIIFKKVLLKVPRLLKNVKFCVIIIVYDTERPLEDSSQRKKVFRLIENILQAKQKIQLHNCNNPYVDVTPYELQVGVPVVNYTGFFPQADEVIVYVVPAYTFKDKEQVTGYTGKSSGVSVRVAKGLTYRTGGSGGRAIRENVRKYNAGDLIITNKRVIFIGKDDSFEFAVSKISAIKPLTQESFVIQSGRSFKNILVNRALTIYASGFINYVVTGYNTNLDIVAEYKQANDDMTDEQRNLCNQIKQEVLTMPYHAMSYHEPKPVKKKWGCFTKFMFGVMCFFLAILIGVISFAIYIGISGSNIDSNGNIVKIQQYADSALICKDGHPLIYDTFAQAKDFYADVDRDKVKVISIAEHASIERKLKSLTSDETLLYFIQHSTHKDFVGTIQINLFSPELTADMSIEKAVDLLTDYLPSGFGKYYRQDSCYKYRQNNVDVYTYSCHLNEEGVEYHNNGHFELSYYYYLKFIHYTDTNQWKLETGYAANGEKDIGWIEKYAENWDIDMNSYFAD